jgi:hypothetical protein
MSPPAWQVLLYLFGEADHETGQVHASIRSLAQEWGIDERHLRTRYLRELAEGGHVSVVTTLGVGSVITVESYFEHVALRASPESKLSTGTATGAANSAANRAARTGTNRGNTSTPQHSSLSVHSLTLAQIAEKAPASARMKEEPEEQTAKSELRTEEQQIEANRAKAHGPEFEALLREANCPACQARALTADLSSASPD